MEKEAQTPLAPPRIGNIDQVLRELRGYPGMPNQAHLPTYKVSLTEKEYTPSEAMEKVKNIATLMDMMMDEDFLERCLSTKMYSFYISSKDIPPELIDALGNLGAGNHPLLSAHFKIDREKRTLKPVSEEEFNMLNLNERGDLVRNVLEGIRKGGLLRIGFDSTGLWVNYPAYFGNGVLRKVAFIESTD